MQVKYINKEYDPFKLSSIWFDERSSLRALVPKDLKVVTPFVFYLNSLMLLLRIIAKNIILNPAGGFRGVEKHWKQLEDKLVFFAPTSNNKKAIAPIVSELAKSSKCYVVIDKAFDKNFFPMVAIASVSLRFLIWFTNRYKQLNDFEKKILLYNLSFFIISPGVTWFYMNILRKYKPQCIVLANDHMAYCRSLALVCEDYEIKTIYVQHASVSSAFPELHFTYSFLDGKDSLSKYTEGKKKSEGNIILLGALRYDLLSSYRVNRKKYQRKCVGIAINDLDDNDVVNRFCNKLVEQYPEISLRIRSHPALKNTPFVFDSSNKIVYKCATDESITDYLDAIDIQVSGDSGVHFDAIIGGVQTFCFNFSKNTFEDNYGYVKNGLIKYAESIDSAIKLLGDRNLQTFNDIISYYDASYGKKHAGNCAKLVADFILNDYNIEFLISNYGMKEAIEEDHKYYFFPN